MNSLKVLIVAEHAENMIWYLGQAIRDAGHQIRSYISDAEMPQGIERKILTSFSSRMSVSEWMQDSLVIGFAKIAMEIVEWCDVVVYVQNGFQVTTRSAAIVSSAAAIGRPAAMYSHMYADAEGICAFAGIKLFESASDALVTPGFLEWLNSISDPIPVGAVCDPETGVCSVPQPEVADDASETESQVEAAVREVIGYPRFSIAMKDMGTYERESLVAAVKARFAELRSKSKHGASGTS